VLLNVAGSSVGVAGAGAGGGALLGGRDDDEDGVSPEVQRLTAERDLGVKQITQLVRMRNRAQAKLGKAEDKLKALVEKLYGAELATESGRPQAVGASGTTTPAIPSFSSAALLADVRGGVGAEYDDASLVQQQRNLMMENDLLSSPDAHERVVVDSAALLRDVRENDGGAAPAPVRGPTVDSAALLREVRRGGGRG
jgi:hypothetical protein